MKRILKKITKELSKIEDVKAVILYGSLARGEFTSRSDVDLFILTTEDKTQKEIHDKVIELESEIGRNIQPTIRTIVELQKTDTGLLQNIFQEGKILYLREPSDIPSAILLQQKPYLIYSFQISSLLQKEKARFNRQLYEQTRKEYKYKGLLQEIGGQRLSAGCVMIPYEQKEKIEKFFKKFKVKFEQLKVWK
jgi:predicted nucleotidyltransferase